MWLREAESSLNCCQNLVHFFLKCHLYYEIFCAWKKWHSSKARGNMCGWLYQELPNAESTSDQPEKLTDSQVHFSNWIMKHFMAVCATLQKLEERIHEAVPESITKRRLEALYLAAFTTVWCFNDPDEHINSCGNCSVSQRVCACVCIIVTMLFNKDKCCQNNNRVSGNGWVGGGVQVANDLIRLCVPWGGGAIYSELTAMSGPPSEVKGQINTFQSNTDDQQRFAEKTTEQMEKEFNA